jgi:uncharacterized protein (DUF362 family)
MSSPKKGRFGASIPMSRRRFFQVAAGVVAWAATGDRVSWGGYYRVGVGKQDSPYGATVRAIDASSQWPSNKILGKKVIIKPNLVVPMSADTGVTTDPEVVRALVDLSLDAGAEQVLIVHGEFNGPNFSACGYDFFNTYDLRVRLVNLKDEPVALVEVPGAMAYHQLFIPQLLTDDNIVLISAAKLKTHGDTHATLSTKNLMGLAPIERYRYPSDQWRFAIHDRGISQVIVDLNLTCPVGYAVVDGIWGMEGNGPIEGTPVRMNMVLAGLNPVAVDRVCLKATSIPQRGVKHLAYMARKGLGPIELDEIAVAGDHFTPRPFKWPRDLPPLIEYPRAVPGSFRPSTGQQVFIGYKVPFACLTRVEIVSTSDMSPEITPIRLLRDWERRLSGLDILKWDGKDDNGDLVPTGSYTMRIQAKYGDAGNDNYATGWVQVI